MATRRSLYLLSAGFLRSVSHRRPCPVLRISPISVQAVGILPSHIPTGVRRFAEDATGHARPDVTRVYDKWIVVLDFSEKVSDADLEDAFVRIAATVLMSSHEEARQKIYKMETRKYIGFHIYASEEIAKKIAEQRGVFQVLPDAF